LGLSISARDGGEKILGEILLNLTTYVQICCLKCLQLIQFVEQSSSFADDWDDRPRTIEEIQAMLQSRKEAALKKERALSYAFSHQVSGTKLLV